MSEPRRVLFLCTGNLCRSPLAQAMLVAEAQARGVAARLAVSSAGTHARDGQPCPPPLIEVATRYGLDLDAHRSRRFVVEDFTTQNEIVALDLGHLDHLNFMRPPQATARQRLLLSGVDEAGTIEVPDPFGRAERDYARAALLIQMGVRRLLAELLG
ncbi:MAG TPA: low molecular weight phosphotyrosine protein phosphatase [Gammaproteobacteria bacterium]|nr:low molecular weight phosphotyrosine protein phosphatase [Gammaproteobacteria bacterium]